jgi:hypothetical protein
MQKACKPSAQRFGDLRGHGLVLLDGHSRADQVGPARIFKRNVLDGLDDLADVHVLGKANLLRFFQRGNPIRGKKGVDLRNSSFVSFK